MTVGGLTCCAGALSTRGTPYVAGEPIHAESIVGSEGYDVYENTGTGGCVLGPWPMEEERRSACVARALTARVGGGSKRQRRDEPGSPSLKASAVRAERHRRGYGRGVFSSRPEPRAIYVVEAGCNARRLRELRHTLRGNPITAEVGDS
jgi:hypothetical protein